MPFDWLVYISTESTCSNLSWVWYCPSWPQIKLLCSCTNTLGSSVGSSPSLLVIVTVSPLFLWSLILPYKELLFSPSSSLSPPLDRSVDITLSVCVDTDLVTAYNEGFKLDDIIVLNLQGGKDFFVTVTGEFLPTCFGSSLETLVHLHKYVREVPTGQLLDLTLVMMTFSFSSFSLSFLSLSFLTLSLSLSHFSL